MPDGPVEWGDDDVRRWRHDVSLGHRALIARVLALVLATLVALAGGTAAVAAPAQPAPNAALAAKARRSRPNSTRSTPRSSGWPSG